mmetsp:Transcript_96196/g.257145  ORF Transcript_96196/g.257145 Transcript_96196/m.257145 type:complete len:105 (+) Transcript_96196:1564-1878(+)
MELIDISMKHHSCSRSTCCNAAETQHPGAGVEVMVGLFPTHDVASMRALLQLARAGRLGTPELRGAVETLAALLPETPVSGKDADTARAELLGWLPSRLGSKRA